MWKTQEENFKGLSLSAGKHQIVTFPFWEQPGWLRMKFCSFLLSFRTQNKVTRHFCRAVRYSLTARSFDFAQDDKIRNGLAENGRPAALGRRLPTVSRRRL